MSIYFASQTHGSFLDLHQSLLQQIKMNFEIRNPALEFTEAAIGLRQTLNHGPAIRLIKNVQFPLSNLQDFFCMGLASMLLDQCSVIQAFNVRGLKLLDLEPKQLEPTLSLMSLRLNALKLRTGLTPALKRGLNGGQDFIVTCCRIKKLSLLLRLHELDMGMLTMNFK